MNIPCTALECSRSLTSSETRREHCPSLLEANVLLPNTSLPVSCRMAAVQACMAADGMAVSLGGEEDCSGSVKAVLVRSLSHCALPSVREHQLSYE